MVGAANFMFWKRKLKSRKRDSHGVAGFHHTISFNSMYVRVVVVSFCGLLIVAALGFIVKDRWQHSQ
jgi:hypothetical protein